ncbi:MAG: amino acid regulated cytosolic protein [Rhizobiales bacterium 65-9]|nr:YcjX family protein [Hyphomicrobiales bacterium]OJY35041.1 MAG: amino acid regulated cytosolic protein [Rhizobiales bacterium 65-9]
MASSFIGDVSGAFASMRDYAVSAFNPTLRLGVTGLARAGKTVFITALVHHLTRGGRLPVFRAMADGRLRRAILAPQPDDAVARFPYEAHVDQLLAEDAKWPESTRRLSELRLVIDYESVGGWFRGPSTLTLDLVDYPGEWLLDLTLLNKDFRDWSRETIASAREPARREAAAPWLAGLASIDPGAAAGEQQVAAMADAFKAFLAAARRSPEAVATLPPGRFLMPGDMEGSPALTFAPLDGLTPAPFAAGSLAAMMERRYEAYKTHVVRPFFRDHFARLDRQVVLVDMLSALDAGPAAVRDLETVLEQVLAAFRTGRNSFIDAIFSPRIERVLFAATKADHLHHTQHDRLEAILSLMVERAARRAESTGAKVDVAAIAALRATREADVSERGRALPTIIGAPEAGERIGGETFDGRTSAAVFTGELPADPAAVLRPDGRPAPELEFVRFRPPVLKGGLAAPWPHIRLDRAFEFLFGDRLE